MNGRTLTIVLGVAVVAAAAGVGFTLLGDDEQRPSRNNGSGGPGGGTGTKTPPVVLPPPGVRNPPSPLPSPAPSPRTNPPAATPSPSSGSPPPSNVPAPPPAPRVGPAVKPTPPAAGGPVVVVSDQNGKRIAGAVVEARTQKRTLFPRSTNATGEAALDPIPGEGKLEGIVRHPGFGAETAFSAEAGATRVSVTLNAISTGSLVGAIHDQNGRAPVRADLIVIDGSGNETALPSEGFAAWDANTGRFKVELGPGRYTVSAQAPGYTPSDRGYASVLAGTETPPVDLLVEQSCSIAGTVALPPDLQASRNEVKLDFDLECVRGTVQNPNTQMIQLNVAVGFDGTFRIENLQPGQYRVRVRDATRVGAWSSVKLDEGTRKEGLALALVGGSTIPPVRGLVRDGGGAVVAGATVTSRLGRSTTDNGGGFELNGLDAGRHEITVEKPGFVPSVSAIDVPASGGLPDLVIVLVKKSSATGKVFRQGKPAAGVKVLIVQRASAGGMKPYGPVVSDATGSWTIDNIELGNYFMKWGDNLDPWDDTGAPTFVVAPGETVQAPRIDVP